MGDHSNSTIQTHPSLEAFRRAKNRGGMAVAGDPLEKFQDCFGLWFTGAVRDLPKPLPVLVEIKERWKARDVAKKGWRPLDAGDPELVAMLREHYREAKEVPPGLIDFLTAPIAHATPTVSAFASGLKK